MQARAPTRLRVTAAQSLARHGWSRASDLTDPLPGVRRFTARGLGWAGRERRALEDAFDIEPTETVKTALGAALLRCGASEGAVLSRLRSSPIDGVASPAIPGVVSMRIAVWWELGRLDAGPPPDRADALRMALGRLEDPDHRLWLPAIAALSPPWLLTRLPALEAVAGRRDDHALVDAIGWLGDPRAIPRLIEALRRTDLDPGRHAAQRRIATQALGRIGDPAAATALIDGLEREALEFEGTPGAGLGVQAPVRVTALWALGELQAGADTLAGYLGFQQGPPLAPVAAHALRKHGFAAESLLLSRLDARDEVARGAAAVLTAIGSEAGKRKIDAEPRLAPTEDADVVAGLRDLRERRWFEAHEAFEAAWKRAGGERRRWLQGLVHLAVALEHRRRHATTGPPDARTSAEGQWRKSLEKRNGMPDFLYGYAIRRWAEQVDALFATAADLPPERWPTPAAEGGD